MLWRQLVGGSGGWISGEEGDGRHLDGDVAAAVSSKKKRRWAAT